MAVKMAENGKKLHNSTRSNRLSLRRKTKKQKKCFFFVKKFCHVIFFQYLCTRKGVSVGENGGWNREVNRRGIYTSRETNQVK